ncbi:MAG: dipeptidyl carboxypeptidase II, partial [Lysobacter sp.]
MKHPLAVALAVALIATVPGLAHNAQAQTKTDKAVTQTAAASANPFFQPSPLPLHFPQFDKIKDADFAPAFDRGMADQLKEIQAIADNANAPTFDNTIVAMERSGQILTRAASA